MSSIPLITITACVLGQAGILPQLVRMVRARSAAGQSPVGWLLGALTNALLLYVNLVGSHAPLLALSNALSMLLCAVCTAATLRLAAPAPAAPAMEDMTALPTQEFEVLVQSVRAAREGRGPARLAAAV